MLTVDYSRLRLGRGDRILDVGCGAGRHTFEAYRRGADVVAFDLDPGELRDVAGMCGAMRAEGQAPRRGGQRGRVRGRPAMPFADGSSTGLSRPRCSSTSWTTSRP